jgi:hypothetical protein
VVKVLPELVMKSSRRNASERGRRARVAQRLLSLPVRCPVEAGIRQFARCHFIGSFDTNGAPAYPFSLKLAQEEIAAEGALK